MGFVMKNSEQIHTRTVFQLFQFHLQLEGRYFLL